jgi:site-specific DNA recombinase
VRGAEKTRAAKNVHALRGILRCQICNRTMEASLRGRVLYFRCRSRDLVPGSDLRARHPTNLYIRHNQLVVGLHAWLGELFSPKHRDRTIQTLVGSRQLPLHHETAAAQRAERRHEVQLRLTRLQDAIEAGADPRALVERVNAAHAELVALDAASADAAMADDPGTLDAQALERLVASLGDIAEDVFTTADPAELADFYKAIGLAVSYDHGSRSAEASATLPAGQLVAAGGEVRVRGGT